MEKRLFFKSKIDESKAGVNVFFHRKILNESVSTEGIKKYESKFAGHHKIPLILRVKIEVGSNIEKKFSNFKIAESRVLDREAGLSQKLKNAEQKADEIKNVLEEVGKFLRGKKVEAIRDCFLKLSNSEIVDGPAEMSGAFENVSVDVNPEKAINYQENESVEYILSKEKIAALKSGIKNFRKEADQLGRNSKLFTDFDDVDKGKLNVLAENIKYFECSKKDLAEDKINQLQSILTGCENSLQLTRKLRDRIQNKYKNELNKCLQKVAEDLDWLQYCFYGKYVILLSRPKEANGDFPEKYRDKTIEHIIPVGFKRDKKDFRSISIKTNEMSVWEFRNLIYSVQIEQETGPSNDKWDVFLKIGEYECYENHIPIRRTRNVPSKDDLFKWNADSIDHTLDEIKNSRWSVNLVKNIPLISVAIIILCMAYGGWSLVDYIEKIKSSGDADPVKDSWKSLWSSFIFLKPANIFYVLAFMLICGVVTCRWEMSKVFSRLVSYFSLGATQFSDMFPASAQKMTRRRMTRRSMVRWKMIRLKMIRLKMIRWISSKMPALQSKTSKSFEYPKAVFSKIAESQSRLILNSDEPVKNGESDYLGFQNYPHMLADAIRSNTDNHTFAINARWGYGKTSLMKQVKAILDEDPDHFLTPEVMAWHYEESENPVLSIVQSIINEIKEKKRYDSVFDNVSRILSRLSEAELKGVGGLTLKVKTLLSRENFRLTHSTHQECSRQLNEIRDLCGKQIVVFVDDLDRCDPDKAIKILESIKVIFNQNFFTFVLAVDRVALEHYLCKRFRIGSGNSGDLEATLMAKTYLDKIIQTEFDYPVSRDRFINYIEMLAENEDNESKSGVYVCRWLDGNVEDGDLKLKKYIAKAVYYNPRQVKRLINRLRTEKYLLEAEEWESSPEDGIGTISKKIMKIIANRKNDFKWEKNEEIKDRLRTLRIIHAATMCAVRPILSELSNDPTEQELQSGKVPTPLDIARFYIGGMSLSFHHISKNIVTLERLSMLREEYRTRGSIAAVWVKEVEIMNLMLTVDLMTEWNGPDAVSDEDILETALRGQLGLPKIMKLREIGARARGGRVDLADTTFSSLALIGEFLKGIVSLSLSRTRVSDGSDWRAIYLMDELEMLVISDVVITALPELLDPDDDGKNAGNPLEEEPTADPSESKGAKLPQKKNYVLKNLKILDVSNTQLATLPKGFAPELEEIDIRKTDFKKFDFLDNRKKLRQITVDLDVIENCGTLGSSSQSKNGPPSVNLICDEEISDKIKENVRRHLNKFGCETVTWSK